VRRVAARRAAESTTKAPDLFQKEDPGPFVIHRASVSGMRVR
jgi:hypothetical protein